MLILLGTCAAVIVCCRMGRAGQEILIRNLAVAAVLSLMLAYLYGMRLISGKLPPGAHAHAGRFVAAYYGGLLTGLFLPLFPPLAWPFGAVYLMLYLFSDEVCALYGGSVLLVLAQLFAEGEMSFFLLYFSTGVLVVCLFQGVRENGKGALFHAVLPALTGQCVLSLGVVFLFLHTRIAPATFRPLVCNLLVSAVLMLFLVHLHHAVLLRRESERYQEINDPEFSLMAAIRGKDEAEYYRAVHTAYLSERVAQALGKDAAVCKTCACYKRIGCLDGRETVWEDVAHYFTEFDFPAPARALLHGFMETDDAGPSSPEATIVWMCDALVTALLAVFRQDKDAAVSYDDMIDELFAKQREQGTLSGSGLTFREYHEMCMLLKQEKLYYDFLR